MPAVGSWHWDGRELCISMPNPGRWGALGTPEVSRADQRAAESSGVPANPLLPPRQRPHQRQQEGPGTRQGARGQGAGDLLLLASRVRAAPLGRAVGAGSEGEHWHPGPAGAGMHGAPGDGKMNGETSPTAVSNPCCCKALGEGWGGEKIIPKEEERLRRAGQRGCAVVLPVPSIQGSVDEFGAYGMFRAGL